MLRKIQFEEIQEEEGYYRDVARLHIDPPLDTALIKRIETIEGVGWVDDGVDYAAIRTVSPNVILLESNCGCIGFCREHGRQLISKILKILKEEGEVAFSGFPL